MVPNPESLKPAPESLKEEPLRREIDELCATARACYTRGWAPATSGNFSLRWGSRVYISRSGADKGTLSRADLLEADLDGALLGGTARPSAEMVLHLVTYQCRAEARAILHVHTIWNTLLSGRFADTGYVVLRGYELLKGLAGVTTHEHTERVPILKNTQNYEELADHFGNVLRANPSSHGVLLSKHGLYTWGESVAEARRHLEALEFLLEVEGRQLLGQPA